MTTASTLPTNVAWYRSLTLADLQIIDALPDDVRAAVERYVRRNAVIPETNQTEYERGWEDAMDRAEEELHSVHLPQRPPRRVSKQLQSA